MDFAALPPEINSGRICSGPGSGPMLAAAAAWDGLAAELHSTAAAYESEVSDLTGGFWLGPASASMASAAAAYVEWLSATAARAERTATQAAAAASAYAAAFASSVPPPDIATNRIHLKALVTTNLLGQNTAAIAATEALYGEMWAQDAAAMYEYASASASAARLTPFTPAESRTNPGGSATQAAAVANAAGTSAGNAHSLLSELTSTIPAGLQGLASPLASTSAGTASANGLSGILSALGLNTPISYLTPINTGLTSTSLSGAYAAGASATHADAEIINTQDQLAGTETRIMSRFDKLTPLPLSGSSSTSAVGSPAVSATSGQGVPVGGLTAPPGWATNAPVMRTVAFTSPPAALSGTPIEAASSPGNPLAQLALANSLASRRLPGGLDNATGSPRLARPVVGGPVPPPNGPGSPWSGVAAELRQLAELCESGILTDEEFARQKRRLLGD